MRLQVPGIQKRAHTASLIASSQHLGWTSISGDLRAGGVGEAAAITPRHVEVTVMVDGNEDSIAMRRAPGSSGQAVPRTGTVWVSPACTKFEVTITQPIPRTGHFFLPLALFDRLKDDFQLPNSPGFSVKCYIGIEDSIIANILLSLISEMSNETSSTRMYGETAALMLAARILHKYSDSGSLKLVDYSTKGLDHQRLRRVMEYVEANVTEAITLDDLAKVAGYSAFHFARKFNMAMGMPPHKYLSHVRLENAKAELMVGKLPLAQIALNAHFSSQASFTRAFHRVTGLTPKDYQRRHRK